MLTRSWQHQTRLRRIATPWYWGSWTHRGGCWRLLAEVTGVGLEPTTNGLTYLIGSRRPPLTGRGVERLDYPIAIAGVPRLVSGAGADDPSVPCLLIAQSPTFSDRHACRY